jgi:N-acetylglutamate synthase-like GNAT family acetyltransferase
VIENSLTEREWRVRRAVVDDLGPLAELWRAERMPGDSLEKQFTDFQVAEDGAGRLQAAVALQISGPSGRIHSEAIADFALADILRPLLWERLRGVAQNHGLFRLWTQESAPFWKKDAGFAPANKEAKGKFPEAFGDREGEWLVLRLREEGADPESIERQFAAFRAAEQAKREKLLGQVRPLKWVGIGIAASLLILGFAAAIYAVISIRHR